MNILDHQQVDIDVMDKHGFALYSKMNHFVSGRFIHFFRYSQNLNNLLIELLWAPGNQGVSVTSKHRTRKQYSCKNPVEATLNGYTINKALV